MQLMRPDFFDSEWYVPKLGGGYLKSGAPQKMIDEFNEYEKALQWQEAQFYGKKASS